MIQKVPQLKRHKASGTFWEKDDKENHNQKKKCKVDLGTLFVLRVPHCGVY
jgi:hypothetical protein